MEGTSVQTKTNRKLISPSRIYEALLWLMFIGAIMVKCFYFQFTTQLNIRPYFKAFNVNMLLATLTTVLLFVIFTVLVFNRKRIAALLCINIILSIVLIADTLYFRYYYNAITIPVLYQIGLVGSVTDSVRSIFKIKDIIYAIDLPVFIACMILFKKITGSAVKKLHIFKRLIIAVVIFAASFGVFQWTYSKATPGLFPYDNNYIVNNLGVFYFHYYDLKRFIKDNYLVDRTITSAEKEHMDTFFKNKPAGGDNYKGIAKGKNLIVIQMEAIQQLMINKKILNEEIMPNLNKFINDSAYFDNFFYQVGGGNTSDAEFLANASLYPLREGSVYFRFPANTYESMPKLLKKQGYDTYVFHANDPSFWNRTEMYKALGFDKFINANNFKQNDTIGWGLSDVSFFKQSLEKIDTSKPFYSFFITLSSHYPFTYYDNYKNINVGEFDKTLMGNYIKAAHYVDAALGTFFDDLKQRGLYDNSVIIIYGDHNALLQDQVDALKKFIDYSDNNFNWAMLQKTPLFIHVPGMNKTGLQKTVAGEVDILPTVANLMGFEAPHAMGKDLFNTAKGYAVLRTGSVITDDFAYLTSNGQVYDKSGKVLNKADYDQAIKEYQDQLAISDIILTKNALKPTGKK